MSDHQTQLVVVGSGPGGYTAAFRAADLGLKVTLIERYDSLGGVCLNVGCIPSKALLHMAEFFHDLQSLKSHGLQVTGEVKWPVKDLKKWQQGVVGSLTTGLKGLAKQRKVTVLQGHAKWTGSHTIEVTHGQKTETVTYEKAIIAAGSQSIKLPFIPQDPRVLDSTSALDLKQTTGSLVVLGGGIIGCEMATVYQALGVKVTIIEMGNQLMPGTDADLVKPMQSLLESRGITVHLNSQVKAVDAQSKHLKVSYLDQEKSEKTLTCDQMLVAVGRKPNGHALGLDQAGVQVDERGFVQVNDQLVTNQPHIYAIGDIVGQPMLAHKSVAEGKVVAEVIAGKRVKFDAKCIPSVAYTDPEVAHVGLTETQAKAEGVDVNIGRFPWMANGRSLCLGRKEGMTKLISCKKTGRILGGGIVGRHAGDLIAEIGLAIEMCADVEDIALTIHPHPTLSETVAMSAEMIEGSITDLYVPKRKKD
jgi:dihydrolipoamide dehydrogenase